MRTIIMRIKHPAHSQTHSTHIRSLFSAHTSSHRTLYRRSEQLFPFLCAETRKILRLEQHFLTFADYFSVQVASAHALQPVCACLSHPFQTARVFRIACAPYHQIEGIHEKKDQKIIKNREHFRMQTQTYRKT